MDTKKKEDKKEKVIEMGCSVCLGLGYVKRVFIIPSKGQAIQVAVCSACWGEGKFQANLEILELNNQNFQNVYKRKGIPYEIRTVS